jgi:hypothetical protein
VQIDHEFAPNEHVMSAVIAELSQGDRRWQGAYTEIRRPVAGKVPMLSYRHLRARPPTARWYQHARICHRPVHASFRHHDLDVAPELALHWRLFAP